MTILHIRSHKCAWIHESVGCSLSTSSDSIKWPLGEDDRCIRLMSWRLKVASPSTSLGSTLTSLNSAPTTLWQPIWSSYCVVANLNEPTPADVSIPMFWLADWTQWYLKPRLRWHQSGEGTERKWRCHRSGFVNWCDAPNEEKATATFRKLVKPEQMY